MISAAAFANASKYSSLQSAPYAPEATGSSPSTGRQRRRRFRHAVIAGRTLAATGSLR